MTAYWQIRNDHVAAGVTSVEQLDEPSQLAMLAAFWFDQSPELSRHEPLLECSHSTLMTLCTLVRDYMQSDEEHKPAAEKAIAYALRDMVIVYLWDAMVWDFEEAVERRSSDDD